MGNIFRESWMRCKNIVSSLIFVLLWAAIPSIAADYNITVKDKRSGSPARRIYVVLEKTVDGVTTSSNCTQLTSNADGTFSVKATLTAETEPKLTFYTGRTSSGKCNSDIGSISPLAGAEPVESEFTITISKNKVVTQANGTNTTEPSTTPGNDGPGTQTPGDNPGTQPPGRPTQQTKQKVIRFFVPWTNTNAILYVAGGKSDTMSTVKNYCGWFESKVTPPDGSFQVYFKQTLGYEYVTDIHNSTKILPIEQSTLLSLDAAAAEADTIWVKAGKEIGTATTVYTKYPGVLGDCPTKTLPVMMFDWLHGSKGDGDGKGKNGDPANGVSADFGSGGCSGSNNSKGNMNGMVEEYLGPNGVPVPAANFPEKCKITTHLDKWFLPEVITTKNGVQYTNATCRSIELQLQNDGLWLGQKDDTSPEGGLFLLDDFQYLDAEQTILNPYFDNLTSGRNKRHNYGFAMKIQATFEYVPGQYFEFLGDDDVWVFINNRLVVDIGGQHQKVSGAVDLDTLGLQEGVNYPFHIFYAERHTSQSNFMMRTSIDLKTETSILAKDLSAAGLINYEIYQRVSKQALSCDFSGVTTTDTVAAPSNYTLIGSGAYATGVALDSVGTWFGGIVIKPNYTGFTINTELIRQMRTLPPGTYQLRFSLQSDETQYDEITFVIDQYDSPEIYYARVDNQNKWTPLGTKNTLTGAIEVDGTIDTLGKWVNTRYPVNVMFEEWATFDDVVYIITNNPAVIPCDEHGNAISSTTLKNGKATFYIKASAAVQNIKLIVSSADETKKAIWNNISFMEPPVPQVKFACIFDINGDGRGDSVYAKLTKPYGATLINSAVNLDSIQLEFGETFPTITGNISHNDLDSSIAIVSPEGGFGTVPFTGGAEAVYSGKITPFWLYSEGGVPSTISLTSDVTDSIGPVITSADISYSDDGSTKLTLNFSEGLDCEDNILANYFVYFFKQTNTERNDIVPDLLAKEKKSKWTLIFRSTTNDKANIPVMGDSIKLVPGVHMDLLHRSTPVNNPFVRISGEQNVVVTSAPVVTIGESDSSRAIIKSPTPTVPKLVQEDKPMTAKEVAESYGSQGHYLGDLSLSSLVKDEVTALEAAVKNFNAASIEKGGPHLEEVIAQVEAGMISIDNANKQYKLGDEIVNAYKNGVINSNDVTGIANGNSSVIVKITTELAKQTTLEYKTQYFTSLGVFVNSNSGSLSCTDTLFNGSCLDSDNDGKIFLAWNMKSKSGRLVGTGVYIARLTYKIRIGRTVVVDRTQDFLWGVRHGKTKGFTIGLDY